MIELVAPVMLPFALRYLISISKATPLAPTVTVCLSKVRRGPARGCPPARWCFWV